MSQEQELNEYKERDVEKIDQVLAAIRAVWIRHPTWRLGQLIVSAIDPPDLCPKLFGAGDETIVRHVEAFGRFLDSSGGHNP